MFNDLRQSMEQAHFQKLDVYKRSKELVKDVYRMMSGFPTYERYALCDQLRRSVISVPSNIAEGMGRWSPKEQMHHIEYAFGSLAEVLSQMDIACDLGYVSEDDMMIIMNHYYSISRMLSGLKNSIEYRIKDGYE
jgi:four helix bundle protein